MKILMVVFFVAIIHFRGEGQTAKFKYQEKAFKLDSLLIIEKDTIGYFKYFESLNDSLLLEKDFFEAAKVYAIKKNFSRFELLSEKSFQLGQETTTFLNQIPSLPTIQTTRLLINELEMKKIYFEKTPYTLLEEIKEMCLIDAHLRDLNFKGIIPYKIVRHNDSINFINLNRIINKYGFINERDHGALFNRFFYLVIHCGYLDINSYEYFRKLFLKAVMEGKCDTHLYAYYVDRWEVLTKGALLYGSFNNKTPIQDIKNVDKRRASIGACSLANWRLLRKGKF